MDASQPSSTSLRSVSGHAAPPLIAGREEFMSQEIDEKAQKIHNPQAEFDKPSDVVKDYHPVRE
jgi:hypothetical protein